jgi:hypothetical protein
MIDESNIIKNIKIKNNKIKKKKLAQTRTANIFMQRACRTVINTQ